VGSVEEVGGVAGGGEGGAGGGTIGGAIEIGGATVSGGEGGFMRDAYCKYAPSSTPRKRGTPAAAMKTRADTAAVGKNPVMKSKKNSDGECPISTEFA